MLYKPNDGHMWDTSIIFYEGKYYLFSMFQYFGQSCTNVWCAQSEDGVHFGDIGAVIDNQPVPVWKMFVHRCAEHFVMNHGSFSGQEGHGNDTLRFFTSKDLVHWTYSGEQADMHPDPMWYCGKERFDHMYTMQDGEKYYGFVVASPKPGGASFGCGLMQSEDGEHWRQLPPPVIAWGDMAPFNFEVGGCEKIGDKYYLIGGGFSRFGNGGYGVFTFEADHLKGPYRPCLPRFRLCGSAFADHVTGVQWLACFGKGEAGEVLLTNYMTAEFSPVANFIGSKSNVWFLPMKKAVIGADGELCMGYWPSNELRKGARLPLSIQSGEGVQWAGDTLHLTCAPPAGPGLNDKTGNAYAFAYNESPIREQGAVLDGEICLNADGHLNPSRWGILMGNVRCATLILMQAGDRRSAVTEIWTVRDGCFETAERMDKLDYTCAGKTNLSLDVWHTFRLFYRHSMVELYVDDMLVQAYTCEMQHHAQVGFFVQNGIAHHRGLALYSMNL